MFPVDVDRLPDGAGPLRFHVIQTDARGRTVEWSDLVPYGAPVPQHPALVVPYSDTPTVPPAPSGHHHEALDVRVPERARSPWWTVGLAVAGIGLIAAASATLGRRQRRRFAALGSVNRPGSAP